VDDNLAERIAEAAIELVEALDYCDPCWRETTLRVDGDEVNAAWDKLMAAIEGGKGGEG
jgi:hypothetical protein